MLHTGDVLGGRYEIRCWAKVMGAVYKAMDRLIARLLEIRPATGRNPSILARFKQELLLSVTQEWFA